MSTTHVAIEQHAMHIVLGEYLSDYEGLPEGDDIEGFLNRTTTVVCELFEEIHIGTLAHLVQASYSAALKALKHAVHCAYGPSTRRLARAGLVYGGDCEYIEDTAQALTDKLEVWWYSDPRWFVYHNAPEHVTAAWLDAAEFMQLHGFVQTRSTLDICEELFKE